MENTMISMGAINVFERMELTLLEKLFVAVFPRARENATKVIQKFDFYSQILKNLHQEIHESNQKLYVMDHFAEEIPGEEASDEICEMNVKFSMQQYKRKIATMEQTIPKYEDLLKQNEELYGKKNLYRLLYSLMNCFYEGYKFVALLNAQTQYEWDFETVKTEIKKEAVQPYYMLTGNKIDKDELSAFNIMRDNPLSGIVINNHCTSERMLNLINEYYKFCDVYEVIVIPFN